MSLRFDPIEEAGRNWQAHGWEAIAHMRAATTITRVHQILQARIDDALRPLELNFSRFEVLALLHFTGNGELPMGKIGARLQVHPASVTNTVDRLVAAELVARVAHPVDGRTTLARILDPGRVRVGDAAAALARIDFGLDGLDGQAADALTASLVDFRRANGDFD